MTAMERREAILDVLCQRKHGAPAPSLRRRPKASHGEYQTIATIHLLGRSPVAHRPPVFAPSPGRVMIVSVNRVARCNP